MKFIYLFSTTLLYHISIIKIYINILFHNKKQNIYISFMYLYYTMPDELIHIRVGKGIKKQMKELIESGVFSNQAEIAREGIREVLLKYRSIKKEDKKRK